MLSVPSITQDGYFDKAKVILPFLPVLVLKCIGSCFITTLLLRPISTLAIHLVRQPPGLSSASDTTRAEQT